MAGGRTGCRTAADALEVARAAADAPGLALRGVEGYEGLVVTKDAAADEIAVSGFLDQLAALAAEIDAATCSAPRLRSCSRPAARRTSTWSLAGWPRRLSRPVQAILRSGCYLTPTPARTPAV